MSRYKVTTGELLEQVRQESKMKDIYTMAFNGDSAEEIAKAMKLDVDTVKKVLGERFNMSDFKDNEKDNKHSENALELAKQFGTGKEIHDMKAIIKFVNQRGYINKPMYDVGYKITKKYASKLEAYREVQEDWSDTNKRNPQKHTSTSKTSDEDKLKSLENEVQRLKLELENEKNATVKPEPNPETGEVPLTVGIAHKYLKDKKDKQDKKVKKGYHTMPDGTMMKDSEHTKEEVEVIDEATLDQFVHFLKKQGFVGVDTAVAKGMSQGIHLSKMQAFVAQQLNKSKNPFGEESELVGVKYDSIIEEITIEKLEESLKVKWDAVNKGWYDEKGRRRYLSIGATNKLMRKGIEKAIKTGDWTSSFELKHGFKPEGYELTEYFATVHSDKKPIIDFVKAYARKPANMKNIDYVDDDAGGNIEFEGKSAHELADKVKAKFGVRITKESFEPIEDKSLSELTANDPMSKSYLYLTKSMDVKYIYTRNPELFDKTLDTSKTGKALKNVGPKLKGVYVLKGTGQQHI